MEIIVFQFIVYGKTFVKSYISEVTHHIPLLGAAGRAVDRMISSLGRKVHHLWDWRWHGENRSVADPVNTDTIGQGTVRARPHPL